MVIEMVPPQIRKDSRSETKLVNPPLFEPNRRNFGGSHPSPRLLHRCQSALEVQRFRGGESAIQPMIAKKAADRADDPAGETCCLENRAHQIGGGGLATRTCDPNQVKPSAWHIVKARRCKPHQISWFGRFNQSCSRGLLVGPLAHYKGMGSASKGVVLVETRLSLITCDRKEQVARLNLTRIIGKAADRNRSIAQHPAHFGPG